MTPEPQLVIAQRSPDRESSRPVLVAGIELAIA
jgi:hypothetical protein